MVLILCPHDLSTPGPNYRKYQWYSMNAHAGQLRHPSRVNSFTVQFRVHTAVYWREKLRCFWLMRTESYIAKTSLS